MEEVLVILIKDIYGNFSFKVKVGSGRGIGSAGGEYYVSACSLFIVSANGGYFGTATFGGGWGVLFSSGLACCNGGRPFGGIRAVGQSGGGSLFGGGAGGGVLGVSRNPGGNSYYGGGGGAGSSSTGGINNFGWNDGQPGLPR